MFQWYRSCHSDNYYWFQSLVRTVTLPEGQWVGLQSSLEVRSYLKRWLLPSSQSVTLTRTFCFIPSMATLSAPPCTIVTSSTKYRGWKRARASVPSRWMLHKLVTRQHSSVWYLSTSQNRMVVDCTWPQGRCPLCHTQRDPTFRMTMNVDTSLTIKGTLP